jgi:hypothetical protein
MAIQVCEYKLKKYKKDIISVKRNIYIRLEVWVGFRETLVDPFFMKFVIRFYRAVVDKSPPQVKKSLWRKV